MPGFKVVSRSAPMAVRMSLCTGWPARPNSSRTSCVFPSPTTIRHHEFCCEGVTRTSSTSRGTTRVPSITVPRLILSFTPAVGTPRTFTAYSRLTP